MGSLGAGMIKVSQTAFDLVDAAVPEDVFAFADRHFEQVLLDVGDGPRAVGGAAGAIAYYPADTESRTRVPCSHELTVFTILQSNLSGLLDTASCDRSVLQPLAGRLTEIDAATRTLKRIWLASETLGPSATLFMDGLILEFVAIVADSPTISPLGTDHLEDRRIGRVVEYIEANLREDLSITSLAGVAELGPSQFSRVFKTTTNKTVWEFVRDRRIVRANHLLHETELPINQISNETGFAHQNHMTNVFRSRLSMTPGQIRRTRH